MNNTIKGIICITIGLSSFAYILIKSRELGFSLSPFVPRYTHEEGGFLFLLGAIFFLLGGVIYFFFAINNLIHPPQYPVNKKDGLIKLPKSIVEELKQEIGIGNNAEAIKRVGIYTGASLDLCVKYVEKLKMSPQKNNKI